MSKDTEIKFVGQPVFKQIMNLVNKVDIQGLIGKHNSDYYYKAFKTRTQLFTMLFGILSRCDSMTEICEGLLLDVNELLRSTKRSYNRRNLGPPLLQLSLNI